MVFPVTSIVFPVPVKVDPEIVTPIDDKLGKRDEDEPNTAKLLDDDCAAAAAERRAKIRERMVN